MNTARHATVLTLLFTVLCIVQIGKIAQTLDTTRSDLSKRSTGAINSLTQIDRNLDQLMDSMMSYRLSAVNSRDSGLAEADSSLPEFVDYFEIFWASVTVLNLKTPGTDEPMPAALKLLEETQSYLDTFDSMIYGDSAMTSDQIALMYLQARVLSEKYHDLSHDYFLALSEFSDLLKNRTRELYWTFLILAVMALTCGSLSLYSLFKANRKSMQLIEQARSTEARLNQVVDELRSGKLENKAKDSFLAAASHDLRQPLHAMGLFLGALDHHIKPTGQAIMQKVQESNAALTTLLSSLLDLSRLDAGAVKIQRRTFNIGDLISTLEAEFLPSATKQNLKLSFDKTSYVIHTDRVLIGRVLRNLIENAITHSHATTLVLQTNVQDKILQLFITDNGIGIPTHEQDHIFSEYYQIGNPERDRSKGLGIGLAIVKRLSIMLNLDLRLHSSPQTGCTYSLKLPLSANKVPNDPVSTSLPTHHGNLLVGIIEDEAGVREGMEVMLHSRGYTTIAADSANSLLQLLKQHQCAPDVLISDYRLRQGATGDSAIQQVLHELHRDIPSIIITGDTSPRRVAELTAGGYQLLHKPVEPQKLLLTINEMAESSLTTSRRATG